MTSIKIVIARLKSRHYQLNIVFKTNINGTIFKVKVDLDYFFVIIDTLIYFF